MSMDYCKISFAKGDANIVKELMNTSGSSGGTILFGKKYDLTTLLIDFIPLVLINEIHAYCNETLMSVININNQSYSKIITITYNTCIVSLSTITHNIRIVESQSGIITARDKFFVINKIINLYMSKYMQNYVAHDQTDTTIKVNDYTYVENYSGSYVKNNVFIKNLGLFEDLIFIIKLFYDMIVI